MAETRSHLDVLAALHDLQRPSPAIYWTDLLGSATAGWLAFAVASTSASTPVTIAATLAAIVLLYRAHLFIHELSHAARHIRGFSTAWNLVAGLPLLVPSSFAVGVHAAHHRPSTYGTAADPEYLPFGRSRLLIVRFIFLNLVFPVAMALRFLVIGPIALLVPPLQRLLERHATSLAMNSAYVREVSDTEHRRMLRHQVALLLMWTPVLWLTWIGSIGSRVVLCWAVVATGIALVNGIRTLGAHRYLAGDNAMDREGQRDDSIDTPGGLWTTFWAPVGHRYHGVHHYVPGLPYHNLGKAYRRLVASRPPGMSFGDTSPSLLASLAQLWTAASSPKDRERVTVAVAAFDFDGTLTTRDTVWPFLRSAAGDPAIWRGLPLAAPALAGWMSGLLGNTTTKEWLYRTYLRGRHVDDVVEAGRRFAREAVPPLIRPEALARLRWHQGRGDRCLVVTASPELYVEPWANALGLETIGSRLQVDRFGHLTGRHFGPACDGAEKVRRLRAVLGVDVYDVYAYGDSRGDRELLAMAQHPYYRVMPAPGLA